MNEATAAIQVLLGVVLACVFLASAVPKLRYPRGFILAVLEYRVLPERLAWLYGRLLPPLELGLSLQYARARKQFGAYLHAVSRCSQKALAASSSRI
jgi:hypothetical protein